MKPHYPESADVVNYASNIIKRAKPMILRLYDLIVDAVIIVSVLLMLVVLLFSFFDVLEITTHLGLHLHPLSTDEAKFRSLVVNVLDIFIVIELFGTFTDYARTRHIRLSPLLDVTIVFTLREILVKLYANDFAINDMIGLCIVVVILVIARSLSVKFSPMNKHSGSEDRLVGKSPENRNE